MGRGRSRSESSSKSHSLSRSHSRSPNSGHRGRSHSRRRGRTRSRSRHHDRRSRSSSDRETTDLLKLCWKPLKDDSRNFDAWTHLLQYIEQLDETKAAREAYDDFFKRYPYCYGYWRKYAEFERRHKHYDRCIEVYERGVTAVPLSVDLWLHYISFIKEIVQHQDNAVQKTRLIYDHAIEACGMEFRSDKLWDEYISWELSNGETVRAGALFDQILSIPTLLYSSHFDKYKAFVNSNEPDRVVTQDEYNEIFAKVEADLRNVVDGDLFLLEDYVDESPPDYIPENGEEPPKKIFTRRKHCEEALRVLRKEIIERRNKKYLLNEQEVSRRWTFEENIKRPYFHVKPLERAQLRNWRAYLDFEIECGDITRIIILFERCLIACALYEEMWIKYARYVESIGESSRARSVFRRATEVHLPRKPNVHLAYSAFEEKNGDFEKANSILASFDHHHPGYAVIALRRIGIERRYAMKQAGDRDSPDYSSVISRFERLIHDSRTPRKLSAFYALKLARFHAKTRNDRKLAEKIIRDAINRDKSNPQLYLALVDLAYTAPVFSERNVIEALNEVLESDQLCDEDKLRFSQRKLDFLEDLGTDVEALQKHLEYHTQLQKSIENVAVSNKRAADVKSSGDPVDKKLRTAACYTPYPTHQQQQYYTAAPNTDNGIAAIATAYGAIPTATTGQQQPPLSNTTQYYYPGQQQQPAIVQPVPVLTTIQPNYVQQRK
ncbi:Pre-mRNA-processing factor [Dirofilaria immitis]